MTTKRKICFIINPISGGRSKKDIPTLIKKNLNADLFDYTLAYTESAAHAKELALDAVKRKVDIVVAAGGDGTLNLVASCLVQTEVAFGIIPLGSGNGFARAMNIPLKIDLAIQLLNSGKHVSIDSGTANEIPFINVCGFGFDAHVSAKFSEAGTRGLKTYAKISLQELSSYKSKTYYIDFGQGEIETKAFIMAICNGPQYGNNAFIAPLAEFSDGQFDLTILENVSWRNAFNIGKDLFFKTLHKSKAVKNLRLTQATIIQPHAAFINIDGEAIWFEPKVHIQLFPKSLKVIVP